MFEPYLRKHVEKFAYKSITTEQWKSFLYEYFSDKVGEWLTMPETQGEREKTRGEGKCVCVCVIVCMHTHCYVCDLLYFIFILYVFMEPCFPRRKTSWTVWIGRLGLAHLECFLSSPSTPDLYISILMPHSNFMCAVILGSTADLPLAHNLSICLTLWSILRDSRLDTSLADAAYALADSWASVNGSPPGR